MALIKCQECGQEISDKAVSCPHCGCPLSEFEVPIEEDAVNSDEVSFIEEVKKIHERYRDNIFHAISELRNYSGLGLKESKEIMDIEYAGGDIRNVVQKYFYEIDSRKDSQDYHYGDNKEIDKIILNTHNEYRKHSANWGKGKEIQAICDRTGLDKKTVKQALMDMEHPFGKNYITEKEMVEKELKREQREIRQQSESYRKGGIFTKVKCPRCLSIEYQVIDTKKKFSVGKSLAGNTVGGLVFGPVGAVVGAATGIQGKNGKTKFVCSHCGKVWEQKV